MASVTAFHQDRAIAHGAPQDVRGRIEQCYPDALSEVRVFDDATGRIADLDYWDAAASAAEVTPVQPRPRGRPRLGVTAREVTLLPRHWEWLGAQRGGASAALRRLVEAAMRENGTDDSRARRDAAYHFMSQTCGDRPGYEEALRSLYRGDDSDFAGRIADWPADVRAYVLRLLKGAG